jgi:large subunit ribosomal protein L3
MSKGILARKVGMLQLFDEIGRTVPVTVLESDSCFVVQTKTTETDGYAACQIGFGENKEKHSTKADRGHAKKHGGAAVRHELQEISGVDPEIYKSGTRVPVDVFTVGEVVSATGIGIGKGFAGTVKRHNFTRGPMSHGSHNERSPGSIGSTDAARVFKGVRMGGHMGDTKRTVRGLEIVRVDVKRNLLMVKGSVPGAKNSTVLVKTQE